MMSPEDGRYDAFLQQVADAGFVHEDEIPNLERTEEIIMDMAHSVYVTGNPLDFSVCLEELLEYWGIEKPPGEALLRPTTPENQMNQLEVSQDPVAELETTKQLVNKLMQTPHYRNLGEQGIFAIVAKSKAVGVNPLDALNGGMYFVNGKVEMSAAMMNQLIRHHKHSVTRSSESTDTQCILIGKRADTGDTWEASFSIDDAKRANIYRNQWLKYPQDLLFARALSRLARQLFPDVIKGCYIQGEIADAVADPSELPEHEAEVVSEPEIPAINEEQYSVLMEALGDNDALKHKIVAFMEKKWGITSLDGMPVELYEYALRRAYEEAKPLEVSNEQ